MRMRAYTKRSDHKRDNERPTSKIVGDRSVEATPLAELRRADADAAAVAQFIDFVEKFTTSKRILRAVFSVIWIRRDK